MHVLAVRFDLRLPGTRSLKQKRAVVRPVVDGIRHRFGVSVAEVDHLEAWQRAAVGVAVVAASPGRAEEVVAAVERFVWSFPELEVIGTQRSWLDTA
ncbi:MAG: DUF503 domain-containing protein [Actinomyces sp.]|nr:MAG: DUF503 domain-containing protein [Actinomyces sp.]